MPIPAVALEMMPSPTPGKLVRGYKDSAHHTLKNYRQNPLNYSVPLIEWPKGRDARTADVGFRPAW